MKKILLIMPYGSVGGMERLALSFYKHYLSKGYKVKALKFIKLKTDIINFGKNELYLKSYDFSSMSKIERSLFYITTPWLIRKIIKKEKITHSISFGDMANLFSSLTLTKEFKIASIHALKSVEFVNQSLFNSIFKISYKTSYYFLDKVVCISKDIKEDLIRKCNFKFVDKLEIIYNPHDLDEINKLSKLPIEKDKENSLFSKKTILFLGRLSIQKSPWHLIKAFSLVLKNHPDVKLIFIGDGDPNVEKYLNGLIKELKISNYVFFLGRKSNPYKYLAKAKVLALSSHYEGTPNVIVESICVDTPIVSSFCTRGITELMGVKDYNEIQKNTQLESGIVTPNLFNGKLGIPSDNNFIEEEKQLAKALSTVLSSDIHKEILKSNKNVLLSKFDIEKVTKKYLIKK
ncbi:MAG: glycosyltransferase [Flavobacteriaceae bacterium]|nr:glycosyltransferase [Flavobacteriaceae bacterium]